ncbi:hypothetical protein [Xanthomonas campestris]|uniref:hypothetical protein n=1 Tax=Xanthomonas campestris TaxID=339 RepID=UPI002AD52DA5|nr:hypothetical protein [Xanthomonas campestris]MEA0662628.1 hypothetical protein [Xanthomonas campestris pv. campestris]
MRPVLRDATPTQVIDQLLPELPALGLSPRQLHRAQARSYVVSAAITDGGYSHAYDTSAKQANPLCLV